MANPAKVIPLRPAKVAEVTARPATLTIIGARRPPVPVFIAGSANRCPDCHGEAFHVGRVTAECAGCGLPLAIIAGRQKTGGAVR